MSPFSINSMIKWDEFYFVIVRSPFLETDSLCEKSDCKKSKAKISTLEPALATTSIKQNPLLKGQNLLSKSSIFSVN